MPTKTRDVFTSYYLILVVNGKQTGLNLEQWGIHRDQAIRMNRRFYQRNDKRPVYPNVQKRFKIYIVGCGLKSIKIETIFDLGLCLGF